MPCIVRRAALQPTDPTDYITSLKGRLLDSKSAEGEQVRSFQYAAQRLTANPALATILVHKAGPLRDEAIHQNQFTDVYRRGLAEVAALLQGVSAKPR